MNLKFLAFVLITISAAPAFAGGYFSKPKEPTVQIPSEEELRRRAQNSDLPANILSLSVYSDLADSQMTREQLTQALDTIPRQLLVAIVQKEGWGILIFFPLVWKLVKEQHQASRETLVRIFTSNQNADQTSHQKTD